MSVNAYTETGPIDQAELADVYQLPQDRGLEEIDFLAPPAVLAFMREFKYIEGSLPKTLEAAIEQLDISQSNLKGRPDKETHEMMGRLSIIAYLELLAEDAVFQPTKVNPDAAVTYITQRQVQPLTPITEHNQEFYRQYYRQDPSGDEATARIIKLANFYGKQAIASIIKQDQK